MNFDYNATLLYEREAKSLRFKDNFKSTCRFIFENSMHNKDMAKLAKYLGINAQSIKCRNISKLHHDILDKIPFYYQKSEGKSHFPARLSLIPSKSGLRHCYIALRDTYFNAFIRLATMQSPQPRKLKLAILTTDDDGIYTEATCDVTIYDKNGNLIDNVDKSLAKHYIKFLNARKKTNIYCQKIKEDVMNRYLS